MSRNAESGGVAGPQESRGGTSQSTGSSGPVLSLSGAGFSVKPGPESEPAASPGAASTSPEAPNLMKGHSGEAKGQKKPPRRHGRVRTELLTCCLGEVVDLSASGMRVLRRSPRMPRQGAKLKIKMRCLDIRITLQGTVVWVRTEGPGLHVVGLQFAALTPELNETLLQLVAVAGVRRALGPRDIRGAA
ncbi:MAG: PilZ domain-containing protein [Phycisphaerales bacterium]|nr:PilZ domain-containing protein [Phycisphaerales bacterium]